MFDHLQIHHSRERVLVGVADFALRVATAPARLLRKRSPGTPQRILLLRLERIGDLLMTLDALRAVRDRAPGAHIHLVVASWNAPLVAMLRDVDSHETLDPEWLARDASGSSAAALRRAAWRWRRQRFDLAVNFEPDIRTNMLLALSGARQRVGFESGGGGSLLTDVVQYDAGRHVAENLIRVVDAALPRTTTAAADRPRLHPLDSARAAATQLLDRVAAHRPLVGIHASGGRAVKQWDPARFAQVAVELARTRAAAIVLTGTQADRPLVDRVAAAIPPGIPLANLAGEVDLPVLASILERLDLFITGDTGPMHLAAAMATPVVALFGPSDPVRYGPLTNRAQVVTAELWCRPCHRVRQPPVRCRHGIPDCLRAIEVDDVVRAASRLLDSDR